MHSIFKKMAISLAAVSLLSASTVLSPALHTAQAAEKDNDKDHSEQAVQMVCDNDTVNVGGTVGYHILYHNIQNKKLSHVMVHVKVPEGFDIDTKTIGGADWDDATRILTWHINDVDVDSACVFQFQLHVKSTVQSGTELDLDCTLDQDGNLDTTIPACPVHTGTEIDQPFFVGYPDGNFHPYANITRAEAAAVVARVKHLTDTTPHPYADVTNNFWGYKYINEVSNAGLMVGYDNGTFQPNAPISRAELVRLVLAMRGLHPVPLTGFDDDHGHWAEQYINTAKALGFVDGTGHNDFLPNAPTERDAAARLFDIALFRGPLVDGDTSVVQHFPDVQRNSWEFGWVEEASIVAHESEHKFPDAESLIRYRPDLTQPM